MLARSQSRKVRYANLPVDCPVAGVVAALSSEALSAAEVLDFTKQDLQHAVSDAGSVARKLVTGEAGGVESQATLSGPDSLNASASKCTAVVFRVVGRVERSGRVLRQTLNTVPSHVLNCEECAICRQKHVQVTRTDDGVVGELDDTLKGSRVGWANRSIGGLTAGITVSKDVDVAALKPVGVERSV